MHRKNNMHGYDAEHEKAQKEPHVYDTENACTERTEPHVYDTEHACSESVYNSPNCTEH